MAQISEYTYSSNHNIHSYYQMRNMIVNLGNNKFKNNYNSSPQLTRVQTLLVMSITYTPEKERIFLLLHIYVLYPIHLTYLLFQTIRINHMHYSEVQHH